ncbi:MAG: SDR family oxidoreductase [Balneolales bacterium]|nr:SDR family oxidoreductase [Balneolales bacterium]
MKPHINKEQPDSTQNASPEKKPTKQRELSRRNFMKSGALGLAGLAAATVTPSAVSASSRETTGANKEYSGKVVLITGGTSGIGEAAVRLFAEAGADVYFCGRRENLGAEVEASVRRSGGKASYIRADVREEEQVKRFTDTIVERAGKIDIAFNNAGIEGPSGSFDRIETAGTMGYDDLILTNINGVVYSMRYQIPVMKEQGSGVIVNVGSMLSHRGSAAWGAYAASKHAVIGLTRSAAAAHAADGIRVLSLSPGGTETELLRRFMGGSLQNAGRNSPMGRIAQPKEVAAIVLSMCRETNLFLNGDDIKADGASSA